MNNKFGIFQALALLSQVGISMIVPIVGGVWLGNKLDQWLGTSLIFLIIFTITGVLVGFRSAYHLVSSGQNRDENRKG